MKTLAVKYRPTTFEDVVEQGPIIQILKEQLATKTTKNCYLFTGGAGTGKTTCARIFAKLINDNKGAPIEIDAASNNSVNDIRDIIEQAKFKSIDSEYKVFILDEVHMLSIGAWNAMLKLIEEPPAKTIFIFATTDPQKIPATILSRVQRYDFQRITFNSIVDRLIYILKNEEVVEEYDKEAVEMIAKIADGGMRDSITLLDKCISYNPIISMQNVSAALGVVNYDEMFNLIHNILTETHEDIVIDIIEKIYRKGMDLKQFMKSFQMFLLDLIKYSILDSFEYLQIPSTYEQRIIEEDFDVTELYSLLSMTAELNGELKWDSSPKALIESRILLWIKELYVEEN